LRKFAEKERTVKLDTQAEVTIESAAELEAEKRRIELQEQVIGAVASSMKRRSGSGAANLTSNFFEDPVLAANVAALTQAETEYAVLKATLTPDHPQVKAMADQIALRQKEVNSAPSKRATKPGPAAKGARQAARGCDELAFRVSG